MNALTSKQIESIVGALPGVVQNEPMAKHTNFRIGGPARLYVVANDADALINAVKAAETAKIPWYVFGGGSNLLVADEGYEGLVIQSAIRTAVVEGDRLQCGSGAITAMVARVAADANLTGFEWAIGVPGTIGGAVYGNAGCYGGEMKDVIDTVFAYNVTTGERVSYANDECAFGYRESMFKKDRHLILGCTIKLTSGDGAASKKRMQEIVETRKEKQPLELSSAGCAFKNFEYMSDEEIQKLLSAEDVPEAMRKNHTISAGWLVDRADARGMKMGGIAVSDKHGNFLVNVGGGTAKDVIALISAIKSKIRDTYGIQLHEEVQLLGFEE
jgi:UDP-N-acetylmuramate dehydrogenase